MLDTNGSNSMKNNNEMTFLDPAGVRVRHQGKAKLLRVKSNKQV